MYRVEVRFSGEAVWRTAAPPLSLQAAFGKARVLSNSRSADQARVIPSAAGLPRLDVRA